MPYVISTGIALYILWLVLSGMYQPFLMTAGAISSVAIAVFCWRLGVADEEGHPVYLLPRAVTYWPWLIWQIVLSALNVTRIILDPRLPISPTLIRVKASQANDVGRVTYANSITLTPGTISVDVIGDEILVHAITAENAAEVAEGTMDRRVSRFAGAAAS